MAREPSYARNRSKTSPFGRNHGFTTSAFYFNNIALLFHQDRCVISTKLILYFNKSTYIQTPRGWAFVSPPLLHSRTPGFGRIYMGLDVFIFVFNSFTCVWCAFSEFGVSTTFYKIHQRCLFGFVWFRHLVRHPGLASTRKDAQRLIVLTFSY